MKHVLPVILALTMGYTVLQGETDNTRSHWAFQPVKPHAVPVVQHPVWVRSPVDAFILAKLESANLKPSVAAARETLLRRVTFDLTGLPPTTEEQRAFLADTSPEAFATVVDRLLRSPHFGERWGRHWLDTARYADTAGHATLNTRDGYRYAYAWAYRDYVINSYNDDKPYDRFILEQIAADRLQGGDLAALGFLTVGERFPSQNDIINDRIDTVTKGFLGLTVACARCHDHKFDPVPTEDYYALHGIFNSSLEPVERPLIMMSKDRRLQADYTNQLHALEEQNRALYFDTVAKVNATFRAKAAEFLLQGGHVKTTTMTGGRSMAMQAAGISDERIAGAVLAGARTNDAVWGPWLLFRQLTPEDLASNGKKYAAEIASNPGSATAYGWNAVIAAQFKDAAPASLEDVAALYKAAFAKASAQAGAYLTAKQNDTAISLDPAVAELLEKPLPLLPANAALSTEKLRDAIAQWPRGLRTAAPFLFDAINELDISHPAAPAHAMVMLDAPAPTDSPVFIRGQAEVHGDLVPRRFLEVLAGPNRKPFTNGSGRLELAQAIASRDNPLTARVLVNRAWMHLFGNGFVPTPDDLGVQSEKPSHPELLDWLAAWFMDNGWSQKKLLRLIVLSNTYQQASEESPAGSQADPDNHLLWRTNLRRLDFEAIRDSLLVFSGRLDPTLGGKPVNLTEEPPSFRRSVYGYVDRGNLPELMQAFDFSDPDMVNSQRASTVVPQQALFFMNSPLVVDVARKMVARQEFTAASDDAHRIAALYAIIFQRPPRAEETKLGLAYVEELRRTVHKASPAPAGKAPETRRRATAPEPGRAPVKNQGEQVDRSPLTSWEEFAQALLFTNELVYVN